VEEAECKLHPLIHSLLEFTLAQDIVYCQRFPGLGSEPPQTGHTFSVSFIIRSALHLEHLTGWSLTRLISMFSDKRKEWTDTLCHFPIISASSSPLNLNKTLLLLDFK
jgi:hypothetical protein